VRCSGTAQRVAIRSSASGIDFMRSFVRFTTCVLSVVRLYCRFATRSHIKCDIISTWIDSSSIVSKRASRELASGTGNTSQQQQQQQQQPIRTPTGTHAYVTTRGVVVIIIIIIIIMSTCFQIVAIMMMMGKRFQSIELHFRC
jgi:hypothetical protein